MNFKKEYDQWKKETNSHGAQAHDRFVKLYFLKCLNQVTKEFTFKGGNLLWFLIGTPRPTIDLDLSSASKMETSKVLEYFERVNELSEGIQYKILKHQEGEFKDTSGLKVFLSFEEENGSKNKFHIDVVLGLSTDIKKIQIGKEKINAASIENIICDKLAACQQHKSGSTRAKDYDDLYRIALANPDINKDKLNSLSKERGVELQLDLNWLDDGDLQEVWKLFIKTKNYRKNGLPLKLEDVMIDVNNYLKSIS